MLGEQPLVNTSETSASSLFIYALLLYSHLARAFGHFFSSELS